MKATIIIPTAGTRIDYLIDTLRSLEQQNFPKDQFEVCVIENNPKQPIRDRVGEFISQTSLQLYYIFEPEQGATEARHAGARKAKGEILVYTDDDVLASEEWLKFILGPFEDPRVGCAGGKTIAQWDAPTPEWFAQLKHMAVGMLDLGDQTLELKGCQIWSNNLAVRRDVLFEVGGYNPDIYAAQFNGRLWYTGDGECGLERKILDRGYKLIYEPRAWVYHRVSVARTTQEYFCRRSFMAAIASSFTQIRKMKNMSFLPLRLFLQSVFYFLKSTAFFAKTWFLGANNLKPKTRAYHYLGKANHQLRVSFNKRLQEHIFQDSYLT